MAYTYWRLNITAPQSGTTCGIADIRMATRAGGSDHCQGGTASASRTAAGSAANAFDNIHSALNNTEWVATSVSGANPVTIQYQFGTALDIAEVKIMGRITAPTQGPASFTVEASNDGASWTTISTHTGGTYTDLQWTTFSVQSDAPQPSGPFTIWEIRYETSAEVGATHSGSVQLAEVALATSPGGTDQCTGGTPSASTATSGAAANAFDDNNTTVWGATGGDMGFLRYTMASAKDIVEARLLPNSAAPSRGPRDFYIRGSNDGFKWFDALSQSAYTAWASGVTSTFSLQSSVGVTTGNAGMVFMT